MHMKTCNLFFSSILFKTGTVTGLTFPLDQDKLLYHYYFIFLVITT